MFSHLENMRNTTDEGSSAHKQDQDLVTDITATNNIFMVSKFNNE